MSWVWTAEDYTIFEEVIEKMSEIRQHRKENGLPPMTRDEHLVEVQKVTKDYMSRAGLRRRLAEAKKEIAQLKAELTKNLSVNNINICRYFPKGNNSGCQMIQG